MFTLHVPQVPAEFHISFILALATAMICGLTLSFFLLLFTSFFFVVSPLDIFLLSCIYTLFILAFFLVILFAFSVIASLRVLCLLLINFAILSGFWC